MQRSCGTLEVKTVGNYLPWQLIRKHIPLFLFLVSKLSKAIVDVTW